MPDTVKTETVNGDTYRLYRQPTEMSGEQYEYYVTENGTGEANRATKKVFSMDRGEELFEETVRQVGGGGRGSAGDSGDMMGGGLFGGPADGGGSDDSLLFGGGGDGMDEEDDLFTFGGSSDDEGDGKGPLYF